MESMLRNLNLETEEEEDLIVELDDVEEGAANWVSQDVNTVTHSLAQMYVSTRVRTGRSSLQILWMTFSTCVVRACNFGFVLFIYYYSFSSLKPKKLPI